MHTTQLITILSAITAHTSLAIADAMPSWHAKGAIFDEASGYPFRAFSDEETATPEQVRFNYAHPRQAHMKRSESEWRDCTYFENNVTAGCNIHNTPTAFYNVLGEGKTRLALDNLLVDAFTNNRSLGMQSSCAVSWKTSDILCVSWADKQEMNMSPQRRQQIIDFAMSCHKDNVFMSSQYFLGFGPNDDIPGTVCISDNPRGCTRNYWDCINVMKAHKANGDDALTGDDGNAHLPPVLEYSE